MAAWHTDLESEIWQLLYKCSAALWIHTSQVGLSVVAHYRHRLGLTGVWGRASSSLLMVHASQPSAPSVRICMNCCTMMVSSALRLNMRMNRRIYLLTLTARRLDSQLPHTSCLVRSTTGAQLPTEAQTQRTKINQRSRYSLHFNTTHPHLGIRPSQVTAFRQWQANSS
jgi:hypothetical protein